MPDRYDQASPAGCGPGAASGLAALSHALRTVVPTGTETEGCSPLDQLVRAAAAHVPGATAASVTMRRHGRLSTVASTGDAATRADALRDEDSALSFRLTVLDHSETTAALTIYSERPAAFDETSVSTGLVLATHASLLVTAMLARERADNLVRALESNREIGVAMGILMQRHRLTREQAFDVLRVASQDSNRKLAHIATEVADTGILAIRRWPGTKGADGCACRWAPVHDGTAQDGPRVFRGGQGRAWLDDPRRQGDGGR